MSNNSKHYDYIIIGSGFGGSVSAHRLTQKGYKVLVIEKGKRYRPRQFAKSNWDFKRWIWMPRAGLQGIMQLSVLRHVTVLSGVGVGGGSLVYGATLPTPKDSFFSSGSWAGLEDWKNTLRPFYDEALKMLGATPNPSLTGADHVLRDLADEMGRPEHFKPTRVGIFFGDADAPGEPHEDPFFAGAGPRRKACIQCGHCMKGCSHDAKNSLDKNYLYLAEKAGAEVMPQTEVTRITPAGELDGSQGYFVSVRDSFGWRRREQVFSADGVVFAGGVMGTVPLLLKLRKAGHLARLSTRIGADIRTNSETITAVTDSNPAAYYSEGVSIGSILETDELSHVEPIVQGERSNGWKLLMLPRTRGKTFVARMASLVATVARNPMTYLKLTFTRDWGKRTLTLLYMQQCDSKLGFTLNRFGHMQSEAQDGTPPQCDLASSNEVTDGIQKLMDGAVYTGSVEAILGTPTTAHILGGCVMGESSADGVVNKHNQVFNYRNMLVCDGSVISANPGVNPSLSITAISEWAMSNIPHKASALRATSKSD